MIDCWFNLFFRQGHMIIWKILLWRFCKMEFQQFLLLIHLLKMVHFHNYCILLHFRGSLDVSALFFWQLFFSCYDLLDGHQIEFSGICRYFRNCSSSLPILQLPICAIPVGTWVPKIGESNHRHLAMLGPNASLTSALNLLVQGWILFYVCYKSKINIERKKELIILFYYCYNTYGSGCCPPILRRSVVFFVWLNSIEKMNMLTK